jgi:hypothetical protein
MRCGEYIASNPTLLPCEDHGMVAHARLALLALASTCVVAGIFEIWSSASASAHEARVPVLVELFTSEGCSSCPPADALLRDLLVSQPVDAALVIGLSEHVDYWNRLGWTDPFSDALFSARQSSYAASAREGEVYTPQMVVDGGASFVGSDRTRALREIAAAAGRPKAEIQLSRAASGALDVRLAGGLVEANTPVWMAVTEDGLVVSVPRGENANRTLTHHGVTRRLSQVGRTDRAGAFDTSVSVRLSESWRPLATRIVVFTQQTGGPVTALGTIRAGASRP